VHPQLRIDNRHLVCFRTHLAGARRVVDGVSPRPLESSL
jgi:hypothetical protein